MSKPRSALPAASRRRSTRHHQPRTPLKLALAGALLAAVTAAATPVFQTWTPESSPPVSVPSASIRAESAAAIPARSGTEKLTPAGESLAIAVARRYRIAHEPAREVVRLAYREGARNGLDPVLILAVIAVESRFNPIAESEQGAVGLMQVVPRFHMDKVAATGEGSMLPPNANVAIGARILKDAIRRGGGETAGLQLYNGSFADETQAYANRVQAERRRFADTLSHVRDRA